MRPSKPAFHSVLDLGLRDVGVKQDSRRLAVHFGKWSLPLVALAFVFAFAVCAILRRTGADWWIVAAFASGWTTLVFAVALRAVKRSPITVVKVRADGVNNATWIAVAPFLLLPVAAVVVWDLVLLIPSVAIAALVCVLAWRGRGRVPGMLRELGTRIAADERVLGDGLGLAAGARSRPDALRLVVATDRRLLVAASSRSAELSLVLDVPYGQVERFGVEWKAWGRVGVLSLTVAGDTHVVTSIAPANLVSIARALQAHGVEADDPAALAEADRGWEEALRRNSSRTRRLDRAAMNTPEFDRGLWLLLALCAVTFYLNPFGIGLGASQDADPALVIVPVLCGICGYVSGTKSSLVYIVPLNLLVAPAFLVTDANVAIVLMVVLSALASLGLWAGSALRRRKARQVDETAPPRAAQGSLRHALSAVRLIRISGVLLGVMVASVATAGAAGYELGTLRLAIETATAERLPVDGRSDLNGNAASLTYTPRPGLRELITDEAPEAGPNDGARWELRASPADGYNTLTLAHYVFEQPRLDDAAAVAGFIAGKDREHADLAGFPVAHTQRVVDGRKGYVWNHHTRNGYWYYTAWFPQPVHSVRVECIARSQTSRFRRLCAEAIASLEFH